MHAFVHETRRDMLRRGRRRRPGTTSCRRSAEASAAAAGDCPRRGRHTSYGSYPRGRGFKSRPRYQGQRPFLEQRKGLSHVVYGDVNVAPLQAARQVSMALVS